jgi:hypothetical protein
MRLGGKRMTAHTARPIGTHSICGIDLPCMRTLPVADELQMTDHLDDNEVGLKLKDMTA